MHEGMFSYHDIYANQGTEYLLLIIVLIALIGFWRFLNMSTER